MTQVVILTREQVKTADMKALLATYNALNPDAPVNRFSDLTVARRRTDMAIMAAEDKAAHRGVRPGEKPVARAEAPSAAPAVAAAPAPASKPKKADKKSVSAAPEQPREKLLPKLRAAVAAGKKEERKPIAGSPAAKRPRKNYWGVEFQESQGSKPHAGSQRNAVLQAVKAAGKISVEDLQKKFGDTKVNGYLQKLAEKGHVRFLEKQQELPETEGEVATQEAAQ